MEDSHGEMKISCVEWIDHIPENWDICRLKKLFKFGKGLSITKENLVQKGFPVISYGQIHSKANTSVAVNKDLIRFIPEDFLSKNPESLVNKGCFIFADTSEDLNGCGNCIYIDRDIKLFAGYHTIILRPKINQDYKYLAYLFTTDCWRYQLRSRVSGVKIYSISQKILNFTTVLCPPTNEQQKIVKFLDINCSIIDNIISLTYATIENYSKLKTSMIFEIVTKGLNSKAEMKDSGIEWIGNIPYHWDIIKLKNIGYCQNGISKSGEFFGKGYPFLTYKDVYSNMHLPEQCSGLIETTDLEKKIFSVKRGDIFFTRTSETVDEIGFSSTCLSDIKDATFAGFLIRFRPYKETLLPEYSQYYFYNSNNRNYFSKEVMLVTRASLGQALLKNLPVVVPPKREQEEIVEYLNKKCLTIDNIIRNKEKLIAELKSYKKSLINECITGKKKCMV